MRVCLPNSRLESYGLTHGWVRTRPGCVRGYLDASGAKNGPMIAPHPVLRTCSKSCPRGSNRLELCHKHRNLGLCPQTSHYLFNLFVLCQIVMIYKESLNNHCVLFTIQSLGGRWLHKALICVVCATLKVRYIL